MRPTHSKRANAIRRELHAELAAVSEQTGSELVFTAAESTLLALLMDAVDRAEDLKRDYVQADSAKTRCKLSAEIRLLEAHAERILRRIQIEAPSQESLTTIKARRAVMARWDKARATG